MTPAYDNLKNCQQQADIDGVMVTVSRQAVEEVLSEYAELEAKLERLKKDLSDSEERCKAREKVLEQEQEKVERLESLCQEVVEAKDEYKRFNSTMAYDSAFAAYDRMHDAIDKIRKRGE